VKLAPYLQTIICYPHLHWMDIKQIWSEIIMHFARLRLVTLYIPSECKYYNKKTQWSREAPGDLISNLISNVISKIIKYFEIKVK